MKKKNKTVENLNVNVIDARDFGSRIKSGRISHIFFIRQDWRDLVRAGKDFTQLMNT